MTTIRESLEALVVAVEHDIAVKGEAPTVTLRVALETAKQILINSVPKPLSTL